MGGQGIMGGEKGRKVEVLNLLSRFVLRETNIEIEEYNCLPIGICAPGERRERDEKKQAIEACISCVWA